MRTLRTLLALLAAAAALFLPLSASATTLRSVEWTPTEIGALPAEDAQWQAYDLPLRWSSRPGEQLRGLTLRLRITLEAPPAQPWAVLLSHASTGGRVSVNGHMVGEIRSADAATAKLGRCLDDDLDGRSARWPTD